MKIILKEESIGNFPVIRIDKYYYLAANVSYNPQTQIAEMKIDDVVVASNNNEGLGIFERSMNNLVDASAKDSPINRTMIQLKKIEEDIFEVKENGEGQCFSFPLMKSFTCGEVNSLLDQFEDQYFVKLEDADLSDQFGTRLAISPSVFSKGLIAAASAKGAESEALIFVEQIGLARKMEMA